jgi:hypothetical protein
MGSQGEENTFFILFNSISHVEEWASLSTENRIWLQRFFDINWVATRIAKYRSFDPEANRDRMWAGIELQRILMRREDRKFRKGRRTLIAAVFFIGIGCAFLESHFQNTTPDAKTAQAHLTNANQRTPTTPTNENDRTAHSKASHVKNKKTLASLPVTKTVKNTEYASMDTTSSKEVTLTDSSFERKPDQTTNEKVLAGRPVVSSEMINRYTSTGNTPSKDEPVKLIVPAGGLLPLTLPDRSKVWLNAVSTIKFPKVFNGPIRNIKITGEAYFEVQPDSVPFRVVANGVACKVYSGRFNISDYPEDGKTIVTALEGNLHIATGPLDTILARGQSAIIEPKGKITIIQADAEKVTDWKKQLLLFKNDDVAFVAHKLARRYGVSVLYNPTSKTRISWTGSRQCKITEVIKGIMSQNNIRMKLDGNRLIINDISPLPSK